MDKSFLMTVIDLHPFKSKSLELKLWEQKLEKILLILTEPAGFCIPGDRDMEETRLWPNQNGCF